MQADNIDIGSTLGGFKIEREIGRGGMGVVYKAHELSLNRKVALKILSQRLSADEEFINRFKREAQIIAALNHPNIVNILSYGEERGHYYFAMEYIKGKDLGQILKEKKIIPIQEALSITAKVSSALSEAGARGVVHRDIKPSNIMIDAMGRVKVTDFGVAHFEASVDKLTQTGLFLGTPQYASPEQAAGRPLDIRSDIYGLGAVLYRMLSGQPPVTGESPLAMVAKITTEPVTPIERINPSVPKPVSALIKKMMAKSIEVRFQTPDDLLKAIDRCVDQLKISDSGDKVAIQGPGETAAAEYRRSYLKLFTLFVLLIGIFFLIKWLFIDEGWKEKPVDVTTVAQEQKPMQDLSPTVSLEESRPAADQTVPAAEDSTPEVPDVKDSMVVKTEKKAIKTPLPAAMREERKASVLKSVPILPEIPLVLLAVSGDDHLVPIVRAQLESILAGSGLKPIDISEMPILREKMLMGELPLTWYGIKKWVPNDQAHILVLAQVKKTGSMPLKYYGRTQDLTIASFSVRWVDMGTGTSSDLPITGSMKFTLLNMEDIVRSEITAATNAIGDKIMQFWKTKVDSVKKG